MLDQSGADGVMIGRGAYGKPWIINQVAHYLTHKEELPDPTNEEKVDCILEHFEDMLSMYGERTGVMMARKHMGWYSSGMKNSAMFRTKINATEDPSTVKELVREFWKSA